MAKDAHQRHAALAKWGKTSPKERSKLMSKAAKARWEKSREPSSGKPCKFLIKGEWLEFKSVSEASRQLGVSRATLHDRLKKAITAQYM